MKDFFVSYNQADREWAEWIAWQLEKVGYSVAIQAWDFRPGGNFVLDMQRAAVDSQRTLLVLSPSFLEAPFTQPEWAAAFVNDPEGRKREVLPVRVRECSPTGLLGAITYTDFVGLEVEEARETLLGALRERAKPEREPVFPGTAEGTDHGAGEPRFPGGLPPVWNVPFRRNPNFSGRVKDLERLEATLGSGEAAALCQAIAGMGGVGKTQLAVEYAYRHRGDYERVWWVRCEEAATLKGDYGGLCRALGLEEQTALDRAVEQVKEWLERHSGWLLVFDNVQEPDDLTPYLPRAGGGRVLITSRYRAWGAVAEPFEVDLWTLEESLAFLAKRTRRDEPEAAAELAEELGRLPLALEQAAAYIVEKGRSMAGYLDLYREHRLEVLERGKPADRHEGTVATTWNLALVEVERAYPAATQFMALCSYLAPEEIPLDVIREGRGHLPEPLKGALGDELGLDEALGALLRYSLIERSGQLLSIHRLVQEVVRRDSEIGCDLLWAAVEILAEAFPSDSYRDTRVWPECDRLQPHSLAVLDRAGAQTARAAAQLWSCLGSYAHGRATLTQAREYSERAAVIGEATLGTDHPDAAVYVGNLGMVLYSLGEFEGAKANHERALAIAEVSFGPDHPHVAAYANNLGAVLHERGDLEGAKVHYERALAIDEAAFGPGHPTVAIRLNNLGTVFRDLGDLEAAKAYGERALPISEGAYGSHHPEVAKCLNNLGTVLYDLEDLEGAKAHFERSLAISEAAFGPGHPTVAIRLNNLGTVFRDLGDLEAAKACCDRALTIATRSLGPDHPTTHLHRQKLESLGRGRS